MDSESSLSIGKYFRARLLEHHGVAAKVTAIYPLISADNVALPHIAYRVISMDSPQSAPSHTADRVNVEMAVYAGTYDEAVEIAENCREALAGWHDGMVSGAYIVNQSDDFAGDAFAKLLTIRVLTSPI